MRYYKKDQETQQSLGLLRLQSRAVGLWIRGGDYLGRIGSPVAGSNYPTESRALICFLNEDQYNAPQRGVFSKYARVLVLRS